MNELYVIWAIGVLVYVLFTMQNINRKLDRILEGLELNENDETEVDK